jgi:hypothetical protein
MEACPAVAVAESRSDVNVSSSDPTQRYMSQTNHDMPAYSTAAYLTNFTIRNGIPTVSRQPDNLRGTCKSHCLVSDPFGEYSTHGMCGSFKMCQLGSTGSEPFCSSGDSGSLARAVLLGVRLPIGIHKGSNDGFNMLVDSGSFRCY